MSICYKLKSWDKLLNAQFNKYDRALQQISYPDGIFTISKADHDKLKNTLFYHNFKQFDHVLEGGIMIGRWMVDEFEFEYYENVEGRLFAVSEIDGKKVDLRTMQEIELGTIKVKNGYVEVDELWGLLCDFDNYFDRDYDYSNYTKEQLWKIVDNLAGLIEEVMLTLENRKLEEDE